MNTAQFQAHSDPVWMINYMAALPEHAEWMKYKVSERVHSTKATAVCTFSWKVAL